MTARSVRRAVLYLRLSVSRDESTSIERQRRDLEALADREGWEIVAMLTDDGVSGGKERDRAREALAMLREDRADVLAVWKLDRFGRRGVRDVADIVEVIEARAEDTPRRPALFVESNGSLRSDAEMWETIAALYAGQAKQERLNTAARVRSLRDHQVRTGRFAGGNVPYGYRAVAAPDGNGRVLVIDTEAAAHVRAAVDSVLGGATLYATAKRLDAAGSRTPRGNAWTTGSLRSLLTGDAILGRVRHRGALLLDSDGMPVVRWEPLVSADESARLRALYPPFRSRPEARPNASADEQEAAERAARSSSATSAHRTRAGRLLSGVLVCHNCGHTLRVGAARPDRHDNRAPRYVCGAKSPGCSAPVVIRAAHVEEYIADEYLARVGRLEVVERREVVRGDASEAAIVETALAEVSRLMTETADDDEAARLFAESRRLRRRRDEIAEAPAEVVVEEIPTGRTFAEVWHDVDEDEDSTTRQRRGLLRSALSGPIVVGPGKRGRKGLDPARLSIPWRWETDPAVDYLRGQLD